jgi:hypothetical protein
MPRHSRDVATSSLTMNTSAQSSGRHAVPGPQVAHRIAHAPSLYVIAVTFEDDGEGSAGKGSCTVTPVIVLFATWLREARRSRITTPPAPIISLHSIRLSKRVPGSESSSIQVVGWYQVQLQSRAAIR